MPRLRRDRQELREWSHQQLVDAIRALPTTLSLVVRAREDGKDLVVVVNSSVHAEVRLYTPHHLKRYLAEGGERR